MTEQTVTVTAAQMADLTGIATVQEGSHGIAPCPALHQNVSFGWSTCSVHLEGWDMLYNIHFMFTTFVM